MIEHLFVNIVSLRSKACTFYISKIIEDASSSSCVIYFESFPILYSTNKCLKMDKMQVEFATHRSARTSQGEIEGQRGMITPKTR